MTSDLAVAENMKTDDARLMAQFQEKWLTTHRTELLPALTKLRDSLEAVKTLERKSFEGLKDSMGLNDMGQK